MKFIVIFIVIFLFLIIGFVIYGVLTRTTRDKELRTKEGADALAASKLEKYTETEEVKVASRPYQVCGASLLNGQQRNRFDAIFKQYKEACAMGLIARKPTKWLRNHGYCHKGCA
jgi:hypothetical protein